MTTDLKTGLTRLQNIHFVIRALLFPIGMTRVHAQHPNSDLSTFMWHARRRKHLMLWLVLHPPFTEKRERRR